MSQIKLWIHYSDTESFISWVIIAHTVSSVRTSSRGLYFLKNQHQQWFATWVRQRALYCQPCFQRVVVTLESIISQGTTTVVPSSVDPSPHVTLTFIVSARSLCGPCTVISDAPRPTCRRKAAASPCRAPRLTVVDHGRPFNLRQNVTQTCILQFPKGQTVLPVEPLFENSKQLQPPFWNNASTYGV